MNKRQLSVIILMLLALGGAACRGDSAVDAPEPEPTIATDTPPQPTPSPTGGTPPAIDTSTWLTYASPLGFEIKYPPTWTLDVPTDRHTRIVNPVYKAALDDAIRQGYVGTGLPPVAGMDQLSGAGQVDLLLQRLKLN